MYMKDAEIPISKSIILEIVRESLSHFWLSFSFYAIFIYQRNNVTNILGVVLLFSLFRV